MLLLATHSLNSRALRYVKAELARVQEEYEANRKAKVCACGFPLCVYPLWCFLRSARGISHACHVLLPHTTTGDAMRW